MSYHGDTPFYKVGEFKSSANPGQKVLLVATGDDINLWPKHRDFIRWVDVPSDEAEQLRGEGYLRAMGDACKVLPPDSYYMDPPDGGNVTVLEQLQRMSVDAANWRLIATPALQHHAAVSFMYHGVLVDDGCFVCIEYQPEGRESQPEIPYPRMRCMFPGSKFGRYELSEVRDLRAVKPLLK